MPEQPGPPFAKWRARLADAVMCAMMNAIQLRRGREAVTLERIEAYLAGCGEHDRQSFYAAAGAPVFRELPGSRGLAWQTPLPTPHERNNIAHLKFYPAPGGTRRPAVLVLHALMSANDLGYRRIARWFNARGWSVVFPHLPYHYSRVPRGMLNGELAITSDLVRNAETLRQAVMECRQITAWLRAGGCPAVGVLGTSYGGWTGALLASVEEDLRFLALVQPIADTEHAVWENPAARTLRRQVARNGLTRGHVRRHARLSSPPAAPPLCPGGRILLTAGQFDTITRPEAVEALRQSWSALPVLRVAQGHFGYAAMRNTLAHIESSGWLAS